MKRLKEWLIEQWDWKIYWLAHKSLERMVTRSPGMAYLFELYLRDYRESVRLSDELKAPAEAFFEALKSARSGGKYGK